MELLSFSPGSREPGRTSPLPPMPPSWDLRAWAGSRQCGPLPPPSPRKAESTAGPCGGVVPKAPSPCPCAEEGPGEPGPTAGKHANKWGFLSAVTLPEGIARTATPMHHQDCESHTGWNEDSQARDQHSPGGGHACWSEKWRKLQRQCWVGGPVWAGGGGAGEAQGGSEHEVGRTIGQPRDWTASARGTQGQTSLGAVLIGEPS